MSVSGESTKSSWKERLARCNLAWRSVTGISDPAREKIDDSVEQLGSAAVPELINVVKDERQGNDCRYWAMRHLVMFQWEGAVSLDDLLSCFGAVARSHPDEEWYLPRRDAMVALMKLHSSGSALASMQADPRATELLIGIAVDESAPLCVRRDALEVLASPEAIKATASVKVESVFEALLHGLFLLPRENDSVVKTIVESVRRLEHPPWQEKAKRLVQLLEGTALSRGDINTAALVEAITPVEGKQQRFVNQLSNLFIESGAEGRDERMTGLLADLLIEAAGGDPSRAGQQICLYERAHKMKEGSLRALRVAVGGEEALKGVSGILRADLKEFFQEPILKLNNETVEMWEEIITRAQWGFVVRLVMSVIVFLIGVYLVCASSVQILFGGRTDIYGQGIPFAAGLASMFLVIYSGPLKDIRQSVTDLGTANAAFIGYIHRVLETSHTFSFFYTKEAVSFDNLQKSSDIIRDAMNSTVEVLDRVAKDSSESIFGKLYNAYARPQARAEGNSEGKTSTS